MVSLSSSPCYTEQGLWQGEKKPCVSATSQAQASSRATGREIELRLSSSFTEMKALTTRRTKLRLLQVCAKRTPEKKKSFVEEPLENEDDGIDEEYVKPELPGEEPDFWEGPQWEPLGLFVQYLPFIGVGIALVACAVAVKSYNEGASDFKETPVYKDAMESQGFVETPPDSKMFEEPPPVSQDAPPLVQEGSS